MKDRSLGREVLIEMQQIGNAVKVSAMDVQSLTEVFIQGPADTAEATLRAHVLKRLEYVLRKKGLIS